MAEDCGLKAGQVKKSPDECSDGINLDEGFPEKRRLGDVPSLVYYVHDTHLTKCNVRPLVFWGKGCRGY